MNSLKDINEFFASERIAIVGVSLAKKKFGNVIYSELKKKNLKVYGINNRAIDRSSKDIFPDFDSLPEKVDAAIINVSPKYVLDVVKDAYKRGIRKIWLQQGAESIEAIQYCNDRDINVIHDRCVLMFSNPEEFPHNFHRWVLKIFGKLPKNVN